MRLTADMLPHLAPPQTLVMGECFSAEYLYHGPFAVVRGCVVVADMEQWRGSPPQNGGSYVVGVSAIRDGLVYVTKVG